MFVSRDIFNDDDDDNQENENQHQEEPVEEQPQIQQNQRRNNFQQEINNNNSSEDGEDDFDHFKDKKPKEEQTLKLANFYAAQSSDEEDEPKNDWNRPTPEDLKKPAPKREADGLQSSHISYEPKKDQRNLNDLLYQNNSNTATTKSSKPDSSWIGQTVESKSTFFGGETNQSTNSKMNDSNSTKLTDNSRPSTSQKNARDRLNEQNKAKFNNIKGEVGGSLVSNTHLKGTGDNGLGYKKGDSDYDYSNLMQYQNNNSNVYDPTISKYSNNKNLPVLSKESHTITYNVEEHNANTYTQPVKKEQQDFRAFEQQSNVEEVKADLEQIDKSSSDEEEPAPKEHVKEMEDQKKELAQQRDAEVLIEPPKNNSQEPPVQETKILAIDIREIVDLKAFLMRPCPKGVQIQCTIKRDKSGFNRWYPKYHCYLSHGTQYLMSAKKRSANKTSNYLISYKQGELKKSSLYNLGKLRSNFMGTEFNLFDSGQNPKKSHDKQLFRENLGVIIYESNLLGARGPRKMKVLVPEVRPTGEIYQFKPDNPKEGILNNVKNNKLEGIKVMFNKPPKWNDQVQAYVLNFNGRVEKPSVKNFQLIDEQDEDRIYMQFGRVSGDTFNMDFEWPLSLYQAYAICLSSFDYKIACE
jgi:tubby-related protein 1